MRSLRSAIATALVAALPVAAACSSATTLAPTTPTAVTEGPGPSTARPSALPPIPTQTATPSPTADPFADEVAAAEVDVECGPGGPLLASRRVRTSAEGVRFVATSPAGWTLRVSSERGGDGLWLETGSADLALLLPPGDVELSCADPAGLEVALVTPLRIEDPDGLYRIVDVDAAAGGCVVGSNSFEEGAVGDQGEPVELARVYVTGVALRDVVELAGYPVQTGLVRIVRSGEVIGSIEFSPDGQGGWLSSSWHLCEGLAGG